MNRRLLVAVASLAAIATPFAATASMAKAPKASHHVMKKSAKKVTTTTTSTTTATTPVKK